MPNTLTNTNIFSNPVVAPASGDPVSGSGLLNALQPLTNRTYYLLRQLGADIGGADPRNAASGFAGLDGSAKLPFSLMRNGIVSLQHVTNVSAGAFGVSFADVTGFTVSFSSALAGDLIVVLASALLHETSGNEVELKIAGNDNGGSFSDVPGAYMRYSAGATVDNSFACIGFYTVVTGGISILKGRGTSSSGSGLMQATANALVALQIRA